MGKWQVEHMLMTFKAWIHKHVIGLVMSISILATAMLIYIFGWWETLGILFLKFGLGAKVAGAKSFTHAVIKAGGKKAIALATAGMLAKRHIIDIISKFFAKHSISRYKNNIILVAKKKFEEIKHSSMVEKIKAFGSMLLSIPMVYIFWTKVLGTAIQKFIYALVLPLVTLLWNLLTTSFNFLGFIFQLLMLNLFLDTISRYSIGKKIISLIDQTVHLVGMILNLFNTILQYTGVNPKAWLIKLSNRFNHWLESILDRGLSPISKLKNRRMRYINIVESISEKRYLKAQSKRDKKSSQWIYVKKLFERVVLKRRYWREKREERSRRWLKRSKNNHHAIRARVAQKREKRTTLHLPYHMYKRSLHQVD